MFFLPQNLYELLEPYRQPFHTCHPRTSDVQFKNPQTRTTFYIDSFLFDCGRMVELTRSH